MVRKKRNRDAQWKRDLVSRHPLAGGGIRSSVDQRQLGQIWADKKWRDAFCPIQTIGIGNSRRLPDKFTPQDPNTVEALARTLRRLMNPAQGTQGDSNVATLELSGELRRCAMQ
jgi:hypothetical protein